MRWHHPVSIYSISVGNSLINLLDGQCAFWKQRTTPREDAMQHPPPVIHRKNDKEVLDKTRVPFVATFHDATKGAVPQIVESLKDSHWAVRSAGAHAMLKLAEQRK
jgi:hypothetical protein